MFASGLLQPYVYFPHGGTLGSCDRSSHLASFCRVHAAREPAPSLQRVFFKAHFWGTVTRTSKTLSYVDEVTGDNIGTRLSHREVGSSATRRKLCFVPET